MSHHEIRGAGVGLRSIHISHILSNKPKVSWFEILADNHLVNGGLIPHQLERIRNEYPVAMHCVGMSLGSVDGIDVHYLKKIAELAERFSINTISDHISFSNLKGVYSHDLLPLPYTEETLNVIVENIQQAQEYLGKRIMVENPSCYIAFEHSTMSELEFISELLNRADCYLLLDINNAFVNQFNLGWDAQELIQNLPLERVKEIHLAGHTNYGDYLVDTHSDYVCSEVWELYEALIKKKEIPTQIEWDNHIPEFSELLSEAHKAQQIIDKYHAEALISERNQ